MPAFRKTRDKIQHLAEITAQDGREPHEELVHAQLFGSNDYIAFHDAGETLNESIEEHHTNKKRLIFRADTPPKEGSAKPVGIIVPKHMWKGAGGMEEINEKRAEVYGGHHRDPLTKGAMVKLHKQVLDDHFSKPEHEQVAAEEGALGRLQKAGHISKGADTLDRGEKTDTVTHEYDAKGRNFVAYGQKGVAGHALYTSGHGSTQKHHVLNTCAGQTGGCGGGIPHEGVEAGLAYTRRGTCFAPKAEEQYKGASRRRASQTQAKHDPAMSSDWILAHTGSLRNAATRADKKGSRTLFRPNITDETDATSRFAIDHLNKHRATKGKPAIIGNSYSKTGELHDPENNWHVTHSNVGPKVKGGKFTDNVTRDSKRVRETISAQTASGEHLTNAQGNHTPPMHSYAVINVERHTDLDKKFQGSVTHAKYWSAGREQHQLHAHEKAEGPEGHFDGEGKPTSPDKAHYGHTTLSGRRYDYQKQHILHPRMVNIPVGKGKFHATPTDSRFKDDEHLPTKRFKAKNGKNAGAILFTTPTTSTSAVERDSSFTHHVDDSTITHAKTHGGEYEVDAPHEQEKARARPEAQANAAATANVHNLRNKMSGTA